MTTSLKPHLSVLIPVYGCDSCLIPLHKRLVTVLESLNSKFEIIFINDRSPDASWENIKELGKKDPRIKGINFSRNFGQHYAITAGFDFAQGDWVVVMDCDLQDAPEDIPKLYAKAREGFDIVYAISPFRSQKGWLTNLIRAGYFRLYDILAQNKFKTTNLSFYIISENVKKSVVQFREASRHISSLLRHVGFKIVGVPVDHAERHTGKSTYTLLKRFDLAYIGIIAYSSTLLKISFVTGFVFSLLSFAFGIFFLISKIINSAILPGWTSLISVIFFSTGLILIFLGIIGMYIEKIFLEVKNRPLYVVDETLNLDQSK